MIQVIKADGAVSDFTLTKISDAIMRAFMAVDIRDCDDTADLLALRVTADFQERVSNGGILAEDEDEISGFCVHAVGEGGNLFGCVEFVE